MYIKTRKFKWSHFRQHSLVRWLEKHSNIHINVYHLSDHSMYVTTNRHKAWGKGHTHKGHNMMSNWTGHEWVRLKHNRGIQNSHLCWEIIAKRRQHGMFFKLQPALWLSSCPLSSHQGYCCCQPCWCCPIPNRPLFVTWSILEDLFGRWHMLLALMSYM